MWKTYLMRTKTNMIEIYNIFYKITLFIFIVIYVLKNYKQWDTYLILLRLLFLDMLLAYYLKKTKLWSENLKLLIY